MPAHRHVKSSARSRRKSIRSVRNSRRSAARVRNANQNLREGLHAMRPVNPSPAQSRQLKSRAAQSRSQRQRTSYRRRTLRNSAPEVRNHRPRPAHIPRRRNSAAVQPKTPAVPRRRIRMYPAIRHRRIAADAFLRHRRRCQTPGQQQSRKNQNRSHRNSPHPQNLSRKSPAHAFVEADRQSLQFQFGGCVTVADTLLITVVSHDPPVDAVTYKYAVGGGVTFPDITTTPSSVIVNVPCVNVTV